jgi:hypothetical protein
VTDPPVGLHQALSMLIYGPSKVGKSLTGASTPWPRVIFDVESAARFLPLKAIPWDPANPPPAAPKKGEWDTAVVSIRSWQDAIRTLQWLKEEPHPFVSATVDSISELQYRYIESVTGRDQMKIQDWGSALREVGGFVRDLRDLTMHPTRPLTAVVITAMARQDPNTGMMKPYLQGQLGTQIPYLPDVTAYLHVEPGVDGVETRYLETRRNAQWEAGERVGGRIPNTLALPQVTGTTEDEIREKNTTFAKIIKMVYAGRGISAPAQVPATTTAPVQQQAVSTDAAPGTTTQES